MRAPTGEDLEHEGLAENLEHEGLAEKSGDGLALTERGLELLRALEGIAKR